MITQYSVISNNKWLFDFWVSSTGVVINVDPMFNYELIMGIRLDRAKALIKERWPSAAVWQDWRKGKGEMKRA